MFSGDLSSWQKFQQAFAWVGTLGVAIFTIFFIVELRTYCSRAEEIRNEHSGRGVMYAPILFSGSPAAAQ